MWGFLAISHNPTPANDNLSNKPYFCLGLLVFPPVAPVVTRRPPELTGGRCHAAPGVLSSVPMFVGVSPPDL